MIIPARYNGPPESANGGYTCGLVAGLLGRTAEVTLRRPPPLSVHLNVIEVNGGIEVRHKEVVILEAQPANVELPVLEPVSSEEAGEASRGYAGFQHHAYPTCFTCGPERKDGLGIFAGPVAGRPGVVAAPWTPAGKVPPEIMWAALDCPSGWAIDDFQREGVLLGRMAARVLRVPQPEERHVVIGWRVGEDGRKRYAGSGLFAEDGELLAVSRSTWIVPAPA